MIYYDNKEERLIKKDLVSIENKVRHAFNQGYEMGVKESRSKIPNTCGDAISRQAVIAILKDKWNMFSDANDAIQESIDTIEAIPSVTPQQKTGRWIPLEYDGYADGNPVWDKWECSKCGWEHSGDEESLTAFCPNCGQPKMESEETDERG